MWKIYLCALEISKAFDIVHRCLIFKISFTKNSSLFISSLSTLVVSIELKGTMCISIIICFSVVLGWCSVRDVI